MLPGPWEVLEEKLDWRGARLCRARHAPSGRDYLLEDLTLAAPAKDRIYREIAAGLEEKVPLAEAVDHPALRRPAGVARYEDRYYLAYPLDEPLWEGWSREPTPADPAEAGRWVQVMAEVLAAYHQAGLTAHGVGRADLVPAATGPLVLEPICQSYLVTYRDRERFERYEQAPEVVRGRPWDQAADLFALGINAYRLAAGRLPLSGSGADLAHNLLTAGIIDPRAHAPALSPPFAGAILSLLAKDPSRRPGAAAIAARLAEQAAGGGFSASAAEQAEFARGGRRRAELTARRDRARVFFRKNRGALAVSLGVLAFVLVFFLARGKPAPPTITSRTGPAQVVAAYYRAIGNLDDIVLAETLAPGVAKNTRTMVINLYVMNRARIAEGGMSLDAPGPLKVKDLVISRVDDQGRTTYVARYDLALRKGVGDEMVDETRTYKDRLVLTRRKDRRVGEKWVISELSQRIGPPRDVPVPPEEKKEANLACPARDNRAGMRLIFFDAAWSAPGRLMRTMIKRVADDYRLPLVRLRVDQDPGLARQYGLSCLPELLLVEGGQFIRRWVGLQPEYGIRAELEALHIPKTHALRRDRAPKS